MGPGQRPDWVPVMCGGLLRGGFCSSWNLHLPPQMLLFLLQLFSSMSAAFTLNFFRSGISFNKWGSFQLPGLLNFGEFKVTPTPPP